MKHTRSILAATLALSLAACSQQTATPVATAPEASAPTAADAIPGAYLVGFKQGNLSSQSLTDQAAVQAQAIAAAGGIMTSQWVDISAAAVKLDAAALAKLKANPSVEYKIGRAHV